MEWIRGPVIGSGATAKVYIAAGKFSGELLAVKSTELSRSAPLRNEQFLLAKLPSSPRIVKYLGFSVEDSMFNLSMEYVPNGTLYDQIKAKGKLDEDSIRVYVKQILEGLDHLHENSIAHCDVKAHNVLIGEDWGAKLCDLGCGKLVSKNSTVGPAGPTALFSDTPAFLASGVAPGEDWRAKLCDRLTIGATENSIIGPAGPTILFSGTPAFMAPEVARGERQSFEADVWAVGCVIVEMATGNGPWPDQSGPVSVLYRVGFSGSIPEYPSSISNSGRDFLSKCFEKDWRARWTVKELLGHPFLRGPGPESASPSSVLVKGLWDFVEGQSQREFEEECSVSDPVLGSVFRRIEVLSGGEIFSSWCFYDDDGEDWLTIREDESQRDVNGNSMVSLVVDDDYEENVIDFEEYVFGQELSSVNVIYDLENFDIQYEISNESFFLIQFSLSLLFFFYLLKKCNQSVKSTNSKILSVFQFSPTYSHFLLFYGFS